MTATTFQPDRRPMAVTIPYGGIYPPTPGANVYGLDPLWLTTPATRIAGLRALADTYGIARRILHLPQGCYNPAVTPFNNYPAGCTLQAAVSAAIAALTPQAGEEWGVYSGVLMPVNPLGDLFVTGPANAKASSSADFDFIAAQLAQYTTGGKFVEVLIDTRADAPDKIQTTLAGKLPATVQRVGTEPVPTTGAPLEIDTATITTTRYIALLSYFDTFNAGRTWTVNPSTTEAHVWIDSGSATAADVQSFIDRGFIPGIVHGVTSAAACERVAAWAQHRWKGYLQ